MAGTPTPYYGFPIPSDNDPADAPHDFQALAQRIEDTLKNGYIIPTGNLTIGDVGQTSQRLMYFRRRVAPDEYATTLSCGGSQQYITVYKNDVLQAMHIFRGDGSYLVDVEGVQRPIPFAMQVTMQNLSVSNSAQADYTWNFTPGRFTQTPMVFGTCMATSYVVTVPNATKDTAVVRVRHVNDTVATITAPTAMLAIQMTPTASPG